MSTTFVVLIQLQGLVALGTACCGLNWWLNDRDDIVTRYVLRAGTAYYMWLFVCACLVGLVPA